MEDDSQLQADSLDDVLSVGDWASGNRHESVVRGWMIFIGWFHLMIRI